MSAGNQAIALLANTMATGAALVALILTFGPVSGAHFNPAVTVADATQGGLPWTDVPGYIVGQTAGGIVGVWSAHAMFQEPILMVSRHPAFIAAQLAGAMAATILFRWLVPALPATADRVVVPRSAGAKQ